METQTFTPEEVAANGASPAERFLRVADYDTKKVITIDLPLGPDTEETEPFKVEVRAVKVKQRAEFFRRMSKNEGEAIAAYNVDLIIQACYIPGTDEKMFSPEHREGLMRMPAGPIEILANEIHAVSGLDESARRRAERDFSDTQS